MEKKSTIVEIYDLPGEEVTKLCRGSRWQYVGVRCRNGERKHTYYHLNCDCLTDDNGHCLLCSQSAPGMI